MAKKIFICYSKYGGEHYANYVYNFCKERLHYEHVFFAKKIIQPGENWKEKRDKALEECDVFLFIATLDVTTSEQVEYEIKRANKLKKRIIPFKHTSIDDWSEIEKKYDWDYMQYAPFDHEDELILEVHKQLAVIQQQQPSDQKLAEKPIERRLRVKSYQCVFRSKPPNSGSSSGGTVSAAKLEEIDRMVREADKPYWVYRMVLMDKLDLAYLESQIEQKSGEEVVESSEGFVKDTRTGQKISTGRLIHYSFGKLKDDARIRAQLSSSENEDSVIQIWFISGGDDVGFYQAHTLLSPDKILSILLGDIAQSEVQRIIKEVCSKPPK